MSSGPSSGPPGGCRAQFPGWPSACGPGKMARPPSRLADAGQSAFIRRDAAKTRGMPAPLGPLSGPPAAGNPSTQRNEPGADGIRQMT
jgi:hypothetical protein